MRLYRQHDLDLIYLYKIKGFSFQKHMKAALHAYLNGEPYTIDTPRSEEELTLPKSIQFHLCLSEDKDADIIAWLKLLSNGYRNSLLKNMFRGYLSSPVTIPYLKNENNFIENKVASLIFKRVKKESNKTEKELVDEVLNTSLPTSDPNFKPDVIKEVLDVTNANSKDSITLSVEEKFIDDKKSLQNSLSNKNKENEDSDTESFDFFGEFDSMLNNF